MKALWQTLVVALALAISHSPAATIELPEYNFNLNGSGTTYGIYGTTPAAIFNTSGFDFATGLGSLTINYKPGPAGNYFINAYFDHDVDLAINSSFNEFAGVLGSAPAGVSYQLDDPFTGTIFANATAATNDLDNTNHVPTAAPAPNACCNVSLALGHAFILAVDETAVVTYTVGLTPPGGFALRLTDPDIFDAAGAATPENLYLSSSLRIIPATGPPGIPEPGTFGLSAIAAIAGFMWRGFQKRSTQSF